MEIILLFTGSQLIYAGVKNLEWNNGLMHGWKVCKKQDGCWAQQRKQWSTLSCTHWRYFNAQNYIMKSHYYVDSIPKIQSIQNVSRKVQGHLLLDLFTSQKTLRSERWWCTFRSLQWRHNECDGVPNHQPHDCLLNSLFKAQIKEHIKAPRYWPLCGNSPITGEFPAQRASNADFFFHLMTSSCSWDDITSVSISLFLGYWFILPLDPSSDEIKTWNQTFRICIIRKQIDHITLTSLDYHGVSHHLQLDCSYNNLCGSTTTKAPNALCTCLCVGIPPLTMDFPHKGSVMPMEFPYHDVMHVYRNAVRRGDWICGIIAQTIEAIKRYDIDLESIVFNIILYMCIYWILLSVISALF